MARKSRKILIGTSLAALIGVAWAVPAVGASTQPVVPIGHAPRHPPGSRVLGKLPDSTTLSVSVALTPRDPTALAAYATAVSMPGSPAYHHFLSVKQFAQRFGPTAPQIEAVRSSLRSHGLNPGGLSANGLAISVHANAAALSQAFSTSFERVAVDGRVAYANTQPPLVDRAVASHVQSVVGLNDLVKPHPFVVRQKSGSRLAPRAVRRHVVTGGAQPCSTASSAAPGQAAFTADQIASAYSFSSLYSAGDLGSGQTVALYELEGNFPGDISAYQQCYHATGSVNYVTVDGGPSAPDASNQDGLETALDADAVIGLAPAANLLVYQGPNANSGPYDTYNKIISDDRAKVISTSWGLCEPDLGSQNAQAEATLFQEAATQGQTIVSAAGDQGSEDCLGDGTAAAGNLAVDDPAGQAMVTGVGGSSVSALGPPPAEHVWNDPSIGAGGGGISSLTTMPSYQSGAPASLGVMNSNSSGAPCGASSGACREVPDVSADADPNSGYLVYYDGNGDPTDGQAWTGAGGTSAAAPTWGALFALADGSAACGGSQIGFANPALYKAAASSYSGDFNDITSGNNDFSGGNGGQFGASSGYDMASGLGTPVASSLAPALCGRLVTMTNPGSQSTLVGKPGSVQLIASDSANSSLQYGARGLPPGVTIDSSRGIISGTPTNSGTYHVTAWATDPDGGTGTVKFTWTVVPATVVVTNPGNQTQRVSTPVHLQIHASDNNGGALTYSASGLPPGLQINPITGLIGGAPTKGGRWWVRVYATDAGSPAGSTTITWTVIGRPTASHGSLSGISTSKPKLALTVSAGAEAPALNTISISLPSGLAFAYGRRTLASGISIGSSTKFNAIVKKGVLTLKLGQRLRSVRLTIQNGALRANQTVVAGVRRRQLRTVTLKVTPTDAGGLSTPLSVTLRPS